MCPRSALEGENHVQVHIFISSTQAHKEETDPQPAPTHQSEELLAQQKPQTAGTEAKLSGFLF